MSLKKYKIENCFTGEVEEKTVHDMTNFRAGQEVIHSNEGVVAGSSGKIKVGRGKIKYLVYQGFGFLGHTVTAFVEWEYGKSYMLNVCLLQKSAEERKPINPDSLIIFK